MFKIILDSKRDTMYFYVLVCIVFAGVYSCSELDIGGYDRKYGNGTNFYCSEELFNCGEICIDDTLVCDGKQECPDGSDEFFLICRELYCPDYAFRCIYGTCISQDLLCNDVKDCATEEDENYYNCPPVNMNCGVFDSDDDADIFPWHAAVWRETIDHPIKICAATIITPLFLISAADCFWNFTSNNISENTFTITAELKNNTFYQIRQVETIYIDNYHSTENEKHVNNIAVVKLLKPIQFNKFTAAACVFNDQRTKKDIKLTRYYDTEIITWTPGPNNYNGPRRLHLVRYYNKQLLLDPNYESEITNDVTKYVSASTTCGPFSDHGGGSFLRIKNRYFLLAVLNPTIGDASIIHCVDRIHTYVSPHMDFISNVVDFHLSDTGSVYKEIPEEINSAYKIDVDVKPPKSMFNNCGKFDIFDGTSIFSWHVLLWKETIDGPEKLCSATIITENILVSAASCFWNTSSDTLSTYPYTATAGLIDENFTQMRKISNIIVQDYYNTPEEPHVNNFAILILDRPFVFDEKISAVCIYDLEILPDIPVPILSGAFMASWNYGILNKIQQVPLHFISNFQCNKTEVNTTTENFKFCTKPIGYIEQPAYHDVGGGIFVIEGGRYYLRGVMNNLDWPTKCCTIYIFTNALPFFSYIKEIEENEMDS